MSAEPNGRVLLVTSFDDREMYAEYLRTARLAVSSAPHPRTALRLLDKHGCDVAISDFVFADGEISGASFIRELRSRVGRTTSIIVISGCVRQEDREAARVAGADLFLIKPALPDAVLIEVRRALFLRERGRRLPWNWRDLPRATPARLAERRGRRAAKSA
jgi:DNA-binding response OmpR family regulator